MSLMANGATPMGGSAGLNGPILGASGNGSINNGAASAAGASSKRRGYPDPEYVVINELLSTMDDVDEQQQLLQPQRAHPSAKRVRTSASNNMDSSSRSGAKAAGGGSEGGGAGGGGHGAGGGGAAREREHELRRPTISSRQQSQLHAFDAGDVDDFGDDGSDAYDDDDDGSDAGGGRRNSAASRHTKLTDLEQHVRNLERENLHLKQTLLLGKKGSVMMAGGRGTRGNIQQLLDERTHVVQEMVDHLNAPVLSLADAARVWHEDCRIGVGVREWDAFGRLETISLWMMIRSMFATIAVDIVELRPHLPDGEMILTKWRIQGEIASHAQLQAVVTSEDCPPMMKVMIQAIKSSDLTFTVTTYVIFHDTQIAEQHHCWDQVGVFKRLFGGEIPPLVQDILTIPEDEDDEGEDEDGEDRDEEGGEEGDDGEEYYDEDDDASQRDRQQDHDGHQDGDETE